MLCALAASALGCGPGAPPKTAPSVLLNKQLPELAGTSIDGRPVPASLEGKIVVVKFFAKYCKPCKKTLPTAESLHRRYDDVALVGVAEDEEAADVQEMIEAYDLTFPIIHDKYNVVAGRYGVSQLPATFITDRQGNVSWVGAPGQTEDDLEAAVAAARR